MNDLKLRVVFGMIDAATRPMRAISGSSRQLSKAVKESRDSLKDLEKTQKSVAAFRELRTGLRGTETQLHAAQQRVKSLAAAIGASGAPTKAMVREFNQAKQAAAQLRTTHERQQQQLQQLRTGLSAAGINTRALSQHERDLRREITSTNEAMKAQQARLAEISMREKRVADARSKMQAAQGVASNMAVGGYAARRVGTAMLGDLKETIDESKKWEIDSARIKAFGLGDRATADAVKFSRAMKVYGTSATDNISLMRDAMSIFADEHHAQMVLPTLAKMKFANEAMFGSEDGHANEEKFMNMLKVIELRGGAVNEARFKEEANMVQKVLTSTGGRVGGDQWRDFIQTGGVAAKQMRKDAFFFQMEPLIQEMGGRGVGTGLMSAYSNIYQGKTTVRSAKQMMALDLLDPKKVEYNKIGMIKQIKPGALAGGDLFKASPFEWMEQVMLPKMAAKGITDPDKVKDTMAAIFSNRTASNLFTTMYMQRDLIHKSAAFNAKADGIDGMAQKGSEVTNGREVEALAKMRDLKLELGEKVMPLYNTALQESVRIMDIAIGFMEKHDTAAKIIVGTLAVLAVVLVICGTLTLALAAVLGPLAVVQFSMAALSVEGGIFAGVMGVVSGALTIAGNAALFLGRALLMNPIGLAITAIAAAAYLIYEYWDPIKAYFMGLWDRIKTAFDGGIVGISALVADWSPIGLFYQAFAAVMKWFGFEMPAKFSEFGINIMGGLINGITSSLGSVRDAIGNVADATIGWFKEKLGIHSPSRVFGELGGFISEGAAQGIEGEKARVARAAVGLATAAVVGFAPAGGAQASMAIDTRAPIAAARPAAAAAGGDTINITIQAGPGADAEAIARAVRFELDKRDMMKRARYGSRLSD